MEAPNAMGCSLSVSLPQGNVSGRPGLTPMEASTATIKLAAPLTQSAKFWFWMKMDCYEFYYGLK